MHGIDAQKWVRHLPKHLLIQPQIASKIAPSLVFRPRKAFFNWKKSKISNPKSQIALPSPPFSPAEKTGRLVFKNMNFKFLFPTFRNRYRFVRSQLKGLSAENEFSDALNLGTGEGDYDKMVASFSKNLVGVDVNVDDLEHARSLNRGVMNLIYQVDDALNLSFPENSFNLVISSEVIEHVGQPEKMVQEIYRVLRPGGFAVLTFPSREFPLTYDPVNRIYQAVRGTKPPENLISQGAYAFGHDYLIGSDDFKKWAKTAGFEIVLFKNLSGYLVGLLEIYWTGVAQSIFKKNSRNVDSDKKGSLKIRPDSTKEPALVFLTDFVLNLDEMLFKNSKHSVGKGVILKKPITNN